VRAQVGVEHVAGLVLEKVTRVFFSVQYAESQNIKI
jgi:hypothetical protein